ncbi:MAG: hypothetical protein ACRDRL_25345 [Sciscionella sp.]
MTGPHETSEADLNRRGVMFWLPPQGFGNGINASSWAELADIPEGEVASVLFTLTEAGIGAHLAVVHRPGELPPSDGTMSYRLWVDSLHYNHAQDELMALLSRLHGRRPQRPG